MELERIPVDIANCAKTYADGTRGLQPTDLHVQAGEVLALLGPSGCGKRDLLVHSLARDDVITFLIKT